MPVFGYNAARALVVAEISMQLERARAGEQEVLHIPLLVGGVGLGKTSIAHFVADRLAYPLVKVNSGENSDSSEFSMPVPLWVKDESNYMPWIISKPLHRACNEPVVLLFDDIDKAPPLVEGALIGLFGERTIRDHTLHPETVIMAAGNAVEDDSLARRLSESLRTRATIIRLEARLADFAAFAEAQPGRVHPAVLGFLSYRPELLHKHDPDADRFPTPRTWVEVSNYLARTKPDESITGDDNKQAWKTLVALKCGDPAAQEFHAWWSICSRIDLQKLLKTGELSHSLAAEDEAMVTFATVFTVAQEINNRGIKKEHVGLTRYLLELPAEHRRALTMQLTPAARNRVAKILPEVADALQAAVTRLGA